MKKILIIFFVIIVLYSAFVIVDCIRLRKSASDTFPLITLEENYAEYETKYTGLGYSVVYYEDAFIDEKLHDGKYDEENQPPCPMILVVHDEELLNFQKNNKYLKDKQLIDY